MPRTRVETRARARVLQALYAWDLRSGEPLDRVATQIWDDLSVPPDERKLAGTFVRTLTKNGAELDRELSDVTTNWRLDRLGVIDRCVLRLGAAELHEGATPPRVAVRSFPWLPLTTPCPCFGHRGGGIISLSRRVPTSARSDPPCPDSLLSRACC